MSSSLALLNRIQRCSTCFGMLMNVLLVQLILYRAPKNLGVYKFLMIYISAFELFFAIIEISIVPDMYTKGSAFFVLVDPHRAVLPDSFLRIADCELMPTVTLGWTKPQFYNNLLWLIRPVACHFRRAISSQSHRIRFIRNSSWTASRPLNVALWLGTPLVFGSIWAISCAVFMGRNEHVDRVLRESVLPGYNQVDIERIGFVGLIFYPKLENGTQIVNWDSFIGMSLCSAGLMGSELVMLYFGIKCYLSTKSLMNHSTGSNTFRRLQWQLFYALVSQTVIPIVFMQLPISMVYVLAFLDSSAEFFGQLQAVTVSFYLATDALPTMFIIKSFRDTVLGYLQSVKVSITFVRPRTENDSSDIVTAMSQLKGKLNN